MTCALSLYGKEMPSILVLDLFMLAETVLMLWHWVGRAEVLMIMLVIIVSTVIILIKKHNRDKKGIYFWDWAGKKTEQKTIAMQVLADSFGYPV